MSPTKETGHVWRFDAIGTTWEIETEEGLGDDLRGEVLDEIDAFDREWSRFREDSLVSMLAVSGGSVPAPGDAVDMLETYASLSVATAGAVNPLVGTSLARRGYDATYSLRDRGPMPAAPRWGDVLHVEDGELILERPETIDVGALGKGRLVDIVSDRLGQHVDGDLVVDASGDLRHRGAPDRVALENPFAPRRAIGVIDLCGQALCSSAVNRRVWGDGLHHVLDARTGETAKAYAATWAMAPTAMVADAMATALFFDGGPELAHDWGVSWVRMTTDGAVEWSPGCTAVLFT